MTVTAIPARARTRRFGRVLGLAGVALISLAMFAAVVSRLDDGERAAVTIENPTSWTLGVEIIEGDSRRTLAHIGPGRTRTITEVLVPAGGWVFQWTFAGEPVARLSLEARDAARPGVVVVPDAVGERLRELGAPPSP